MPRTAQQAQAAIPAAPALRASQLVGGYGERAVLHGVSLAIEPGEMLAIVGPNGAGKSTLLRLLGGSLRPWQGTVELLGAPLASFERRAPARLRRTGKFRRLLVHRA
jgi:ABC-type multidrug transport system ATPase subunit